MTTTPFTDLPSFKRVKVGDQVLIHGSYWAVIEVYRYSLKIEQHRGPGLTSTMYPTLAHLRKIHGSKLVAQEN